KINLRERTIYTKDLTVSRAERFELSLQVLSIKVLKIGIYMNINFLIQKRSNSFNQYSFQLAFYLLNYALVLH
ncbi:MAG: hypothetical protein N4S10_07400, partial [Lactobacillus crispatus]|nr:hypothetical protein [Lactobacillus crispatus]